MGVKDVRTFSVKDEYQALKQLVQQSLEEADVLLLTGGISVGDYDFVYKALQENGVEELFYKLKQKPGKPLYAGKKEWKWIFALPGNPSSVLVCFNQYVQPCLLGMMGHQSVFQPNATLPLNNDYEKKGTLTHFLKAKKENGGVTILSGQDSFNLLPFAEADCWVLMPEEINSFKKGELASIFFL
jgi:molybdopterin molybdotransferase